MPAEKTHESADFIVVGSGIAGLTFALSVAKRGRVIIVTKKDDAESATNMAQGGIAAVVEGTDSFEQHVRDTLTAGVGLCHREAVEIAVRSGPGAVGRLMSWGARFSTEIAADGGEHFSLGQEGGHSARRIVHAADMTGEEIETALLAAVGVLPNIEVLGGPRRDRRRHRRVRGGRRCAGVHVLDVVAGRVRTVVAPVTVLATGGCGKVYLYTTNPDIASGDGIAIAYRAGVPVRNMEFIQFHPTCLYHPDVKSFLISEAVRGRGRRAPGPERREDHGGRASEGGPRAAGHRRPRDRPDDEGDGRQARRSRPDPSRCGPGAGAVPEHQQAPARARR